MCDASHSVKVAALVKVNLKCEEKRKPQTFFDRPKWLTKGEISSDVKCDIFPPLDRVVSPSLVHLHLLT